MAKIKNQIKKLNESTMDNYLVFIKLNLHPLSEKKTTMSSTHYIILSWNVDGYNNDVHNWLLQLVKISRPDVIFLSETKRKAQDLTSLFSVFTEYNIIINAHIPTNFHGVAMFIRKDHSYEELPITMNIPVRKDSKSKEAAIGRIIVIRLNKEMYII